VPSVAIGEIITPQVRKRQKVLALDSAESYAKSEVFPLSGDTHVLKGDQF